MSAPILAADANVKLYRAETESADIRLQIAMTDCTVNGKTLPYTVSVEIKTKVAETFTKFTGCGQYLPDYRLHDIWALESLNGKPISENDFAKERPYIEINTTNRTFQGFAGCNTMRGEIFSEQNKLRFTNIVSTRKLCPPPNQEDAFLKALRSSTQFKLENGKLYLSNPSTDTAVFKKVD